jgi:hypothetical protein
MDEYYERHLAAGGSIFDAEPASLGETLAELSPDDDLQEEMLP